MADVTDTGKTRGLFQVYVVDFKNDFPFDPVVVVAESSEAAKSKAFRKIGYLEGSSDYYDFVIHKLGDVRARREVQEATCVEAAGTGCSELCKGRIADATVSNLMDQTTVFCYCGGELGRATPDGVDTCRLSRKCGQCGAIYELSVEVTDPSAGELTVLLKEKENAGATAS